MNPRWKIGGAGLIVTMMIVAALVLRNRDEEPGPIRPDAPDGEPDPLAAALTLERNDERQPVITEPPPEEAEEATFTDEGNFLEDAEIEPLPPLLGRAVDVEGFGVAGVPVVMVPFGHGGEGLESALSDAEGWFVIESPSPSGEIEATGEQWTTLFQPRLLEPNPTAPPILVVAPAITLGGTVRDDTGGAVAGARVRVLIEDGLRAGLTKELATLTDERGVFEMRSIPGVKGMDLEVKRKGFRRHRRSLPAASDLDLGITLIAQPSRFGVVRGRVVDEGEEPIPDAWVGLGDAVAGTDHAGEFELHVNDEGNRMLRAVAGGCRPVSLPAYPGLPLAEAFPDPLVLVLDRTMLSIVVEVRHSDGSPAEGISVWTPDTTLFGRIPVDSDRHDWRVERTVEQLVGGQFYDLGSDFGWGNRKPGIHELRGLLDHRYTICAFDPATLALVWSEPLTPRSSQMSDGEPQAVLEFPTPEVRRCASSASSPCRTRAGETRSPRCGKGIRSSPTPRDASRSRAWPATRSGSRSARGGWPRGSARNSTTTLISPRWGFAARSAAGCRWCTREARVPIPSSCATNATSRWASASSADG